MHHVSKASSSKAEASLAIPTTTKATAYHEAGHAVAQIGCGLTFAWVVVGHREWWFEVEDDAAEDGRRMEKGASTGHINGTSGGMVAIRQRVEAGKPLTPKQRTRVWTEAVTCFAGPAAEAFYARRPLDHVLRYGGAHDYVEATDVLRLIDVSPRAAATTAWRFVVANNRQITTVANVLWEKGSLRSDTVRGILADLEPLVVTT